MASPQDRLLAGGDRPTGHLGGGLLCVLPPAGALTVCVCVCVDARASRPLDIDSQQRVCMCVCHTWLYHTQDKATPSVICQSPWNPQQDVPSGTTCRCNKGRRRRRTHGRLLRSKDVR